MNKNDKVWIGFWGSKRKGSHIHHIKPKAEGGKNEIGNLIELHPDDHELIHRMRGDVRSANFVYALRDGHSESTKKKIGEANRKNYDSPEKCPFYGKKHSEETLELMRKPKSEEHKRKLSESRKGRFGNNKHPNWISDDIRTEVVEVYLTGMFKQKEISAGFNISEPTTSRIINNFKEEYYGDQLIT